MQHDLPSPRRVNPWLQYISLVGLRPQIHPRFKHSCSASSPPITKQHASSHQWKPTQPSEQLRSRHSAQPSSSLGRSGMCTLLHSLVAVYKHPSEQSSVVSGVYRTFEPAFVCANEAARPLRRHPRSRLFTVLESWLASNCLSPVAAIEPAHQPTDFAQPAHSPPDCSASSPSSIIQLVVAPSAQPAEQPLSCPSVHPAPVKQTVKIKLTQPSAQPNVHPSFLPSNQPSCEQSSVSSP